MNLSYYAIDLGSFFLSFSFCLAQWMLRHFFYRSFHRKWDKQIPFSPHFIQVYLGGRRGEFNLSMQRRASGYHATILELVQHWHLHLIYMNFRNSPSCIFTCTHFPLAIAEWSLSLDISSRSLIPVSRFNLVWNRPWTAQNKVVATINSMWLCSLEDQGTV